MRVRRGIWLSRIVIGVLLGVAGLVGAVLLSSLTPRVLRRNQDWLRRDLFRRYNDVNRISAGTPRSLFALLHHVGRRSGRTYETPLGVLPYGDGFLLPLTYGRECDWCRNVFAAGTCTLAWKGQTYELSRPEIIAGPEAMRAWPAWQRIPMRGAGVQEFVWLHGVAK
jgi:deazaflavin-dependent oxidoreductase (nitroreductase family)